MYLGLILTVVVLLFYFPKMKISLTAAPGVTFTVMVYLIS